MSGLQGTYQTSYQPPEHAAHRAQPGGADHVPEAQPNPSGVGSQGAFTQGPVYRRSYRTARFFACWPRETAGLAGTPTAGPSLFPRSRKDRTELFAHIRSTRGLTALAAGQRVSFLRGACERTGRIEARATDDEAAR
jgi:hypothetical protein